MRHDEFQHDLVEIGPMVAAIALSETHDALGGRLIVVVVPIDMTGSYTILYQPPKPMPEPMMI